MKNLITGGSGFLGRYIARQLLEQGHEVVLYNRSQAPDDLKQCTWIQGDINETMKLTRAMDGCHNVFHTAAIAGVWGDEKLFYKVNTQGTQSVINACLGAKVTNLIYTSSPSVVFGIDAIENGNESLPYPDKYLTSYPKSKAEGEKLVLAANGEQLKTCSLRPHLIWGPEDQHLIPRLLEKAKSKKLKQVGDGNNLVDLTYVENAAKAHLQAAAELDKTSKPAGKAYFISDPKPVSLWPWIKELLSLSDCPLPNGKISYAKAAKIGAILEWVYKSFKLSGEPPMTRFVAAQLAKAHYFDNTAAKSDFGYAPSIDNEEGLKRTFAWLKKSGKI
ncbi:NAD-dependent epimerase/dehydratase family protein [Lentisphaera profundi]|uniref:NAD-dependent epimerase/dehydratase family protein n=1 Tax=Lentisphaera profundi TaxID=1658616 RepID=A0ABY7VN34_9BACT|nr:NAD-dependent epimerase/dehydratase family protein [Lentisphaera profundi]WDE95493.1 NAD-dependent epimerase/dehydratase family protein [Lentisphaera profundi]